MSHICSHSDGVYLWRKASCIRRIFHCVFFLVGGLGLQLYELDDDPERKEFLDDLFIFMQKRGECALFQFFSYLLSAYCRQFTLRLNSSPQSARVLTQEDRAVYC